MESLPDSASSNTDQPPCPASPFLKWAGGKGQLLETIDTHLPPCLKTGAIKKYFEPMIGGGAVFFFLAQKYNLPALHIGDANEELILAYRTIQQAAPALVHVLRDLEERYFKLSDVEQQAYFYEIRSLFNENRRRIDFTQFSGAWVERTAQIIFLNRTCFNGLFRVNRGGGFNVPFGRYDNPTICNAPNLPAVSALLQRTEIRHGDFSVFQDEIGPDSFVYFDPPYRPLCKTSSFTAYAKSSFNDSEQLRLAGLFRKLDKQGALLMLSNSDPKNQDPDDAFFDEAYAGFNVRRVQANRMINSKAAKRGPVSELIITNYLATAA